jgi:hypothetical protein
MKHIGYIPARQCPVFMHHVTTYDEVATVAVPSRHTVVFLAGDASAISADSIGRAAERLLGAGLAYICTWGPDCQRVHDIFDECYVGDGTTEPTFDFTSTWHSSDTIEEAVEFFAFTAVPSDSAFDDLSYLAILVGPVQSDVDFIDTISTHISQTI